MPIRMRFMEFLLLSFCYYLHCLPFHLSMCSYSHTFLIFYHFSIIDVFNTPSFVLHTANQHCAPVWSPSRVTDIKTENMQREFAICRKSAASSHQDIFSQVTSSPFRPRSNHKIFSAGSLRTKWIKPDSKLCKKLQRIF